MGEIIAGTLALAARQEGEGQYNIAKMLREGDTTAANKRTFR